MPPSRCQVSTAVSAGKGMGASFPVGAGAVAVPVGIAEGVPAGRLGTGCAVAAGEPQAVINRSASVNTKEIRLGVMVITPGSGHKDGPGPQNVPAPAQTNGPVYPKRSQYKIPTTIPSSTPPETSSGV